MDKMSEKERMNEMIEAIMKAARGDYSVQVELSGKNDDLDSLAMGLNMMVDDIRANEEGIKQVVEEWSVTFDSITDLVSIHDKDFKIVRVNKAYANAFKMKPQELIGRTCYEVVHETKEPWPNCPHKRALETKQPVTVEFFEPHLGVHLQVLVSPIFDDKGEVTSTVHLARDITERKRMEHALNERVKELQCLYDIAYIAERPGITLDELCQEVVSLLPAGWQYPEITCARVTLGDKEFMTDNFKTTEWKLSTNIKVKEQKEGTIEVYYLEARPEFAEGPFLKEERLLIDVVAERLGRITEREQAEEALRSFNKLAVGREFRMIELKKEINNILRKLGEEPRYKIVE